MNLGVLRAAALIAVPVGAVGAVGLFLRVALAQRTPLLLIVLFIGWILSPFVVLAWANVSSRRWSVPTQAALYSVTVVITLASLAVYGNVIVVAPPGAPKAAIFVVTAPASCLLIAIIVPLAALASRRTVNQSPRRHA